MIDCAPSARPRTCVGCGRVTSRAQLALRIAAGREGSVRVGKGEPGRGAWLCGPDCLAEALRRGRLDRALRRKLSGDDHVALRERLRK